MIYEIFRIGKSRDRQQISGCWAPPPVFQKHCSAPSLTVPGAAVLPVLGSGAICCLFSGISLIFLWICLNPTPYPQILPISSNKTIPELTKSMAVLLK